MAPVAIPEVGDGLLDAADEIGAWAEADRLAADAAGRLSERVVEALADRGLLAMKLPAAVGGADLDGPTITAVLERLAVHDGAAAWNAMAMGTAAAFVASRLPDEGVAEVAAGGAWPRFAGTFPASGRARAVPGGWRVSGRWGFASGIHHAEWIAGGCVVEGAPDRRLVWFAAPRTDIVVEDTWDAPGLRATGSTHYRAEDVFVPAARTFALEGGACRGGPMHRLPTLGYLLGDHSAVALGLARRALTETAAAAAGRLRPVATTSSAERGAFQHELGRLDVALRAARALFREEVAAMGAAAAAGRAVTPAEVVRARASATQVGTVVVEAATFAHRAAGAAGVLDRGPGARAVSDALVLTQHLYFDDEVLDQWGRCLLADAPSATPNT
jgi:alkylation response protein AidB-like acyl-CoA dehydrogenase